MDIDLLPAAWRLAQWQRRWLRGCAVVGALLALLAGVGAGVLASTTDRQAARLAQLRERHAERVEQLREVAALRDLVTAMRALDAAVLALRTGPADRALFERLDRALIAAPVHFTRWQLERIAADTASPSARMSIHGEAEDLAMLTRFVDALQAEPGVRSARLLRTAAGAGSTLTFDLDVVLGTPS